MVPSITQSCMLHNIFLGFSSFDNNESVSEIIVK